MRNERNDYPMGLGTPLGGESKRKTVETKYLADLGRAKERILPLSSSTNGRVWAATTTINW